MNKKKKRTDIFVRELNQDDAYKYSMIANGNKDLSLHLYTRFFEASTIKEAERRIKSYTTKYEKLYGLFTKANRLVAVFNVIDDVDMKATVHYFVGKQFRGHGYATLGIQLLAELLADQYSDFYFEIDEQNLASLSVQKKLGSQKVRYSNYFFGFAYAL